jgi:hypothetical protein
MLTFTVKDGLEYQNIHWKFGICRCQIGPAPKMTVLDKALSIMKRYERKGMTDRPAYDYAQNLAMKILFS